MLVNSNETPMFNHFTQSVPATALPHYQTPNQGYNLNSPFFTTNNFPNNSLALFNKFPTTYHQEQMPHNIPLNSIPPQSQFQLSPCANQQFMYPSNQQLQKQHQQHQQHHGTLPSNNQLQLKQEFIKQEPSVHQQRKPHLFSN